MANIGLAIKREGVVTGLRYWIQSVTGEDPEVVRDGDRTEIKWKPGQAEKMTAYFLEQMKDRPPEPGDLQVSVETKPVLIPFLFKQYWPWLIGISGALIFIGRMTR